MGLRNEISTVVDGLHLEEGEVVFAMGLRKEISVGLWVWCVWWVLIEEFVGMVGMVSLLWV